MRTNFAVWIGLFVIAVLVASATKYYAYFPGDVVMERCVQSLLPQNLNWAETVSRSAEFPWVLFILALVFYISWVLAGWRAALISVLSFLGMLLLGKWLGPIMARPRPSPEFVRVYRQFPGYSFPSSFALRYAATIGFLAVLIAAKSQGARRTVILILCAALLIFGWVARVALAAHWPSDVTISYYLGFLWAAFLIRFLK